MHKLIVRIFEIIDTYYEKTEAEEIEKEIISYIRNLSQERLEELRRF